jgi:4-diphosphocytidyl-2-C-methyl-D-erythritol kinase
MTTSSPWRVQTAVKINLHLGVGPVADDGYHPVKTVLQALQMGDVLELSRSAGPGWTLDVAGPGDVPRGSDNLVARAMSMVEAAARRLRPDEQHGVHVKLTKKVPAGAGLGGGSGDAGAALKALSVFAGVPLGYRTLLGMARKLGADVPFFLNGGLAAAAGRGDRLRPLAPLPSLHAIVAVPPFQLPTAKVYAWFDEESLTSRGAGFRMRPALGRLRRMRSVPEFYNDLERPVFRRHPDLAEMRTRLRSMGALVSGLSGSGSAVFALFHDPPPPGRDLEQNRREGWEFHHCQTLTGGAYLSRFCAPGASTQGDH